VTTPKGRCPPRESSAPSTPSVVSAAPDDHAAVGVSFAALGEATDVVSATTKTKRRRSINDVFFKARSARVAPLPWPSDDDDDELLLDHRARAACPLSMNMINSCSCCSSSSSSCSCDNLSRRSSGSSGGGGDFPLSTIAEDIAESNNEEEEEEEEDPPPSAPTPRPRATSSNKARVEGFPLRRKGGLTNTSTI